MAIVNIQVELTQNHIDALKRVDQNGIFHLQDDIEAAMALELLVSDVLCRSKVYGNNVVPFKLIR